jgi:hypothetical protein
MSNTTAVTVKVGDDCVGMSRILGPYGPLWFIKHNGRVLRACDNPAHARTFFFFKIRELREGMAA